MNARYFDAHCHLQLEQFAHDEKEVIAQMQEHCIGGIVVGVDYESSKKAVALAEKHDGLYAAVGLHPNRVGQEFFDGAAYHALASHSKVVAMGECGLDYFRPIGMNDEMKRAQKEALLKHINLAASLTKPLIIHCRPSRGTQDAYHDLIAILQEAKSEHPRLCGDIHFFAGGASEAKRFFALDFMISFTAVITFARDYDDVIRIAPLRNILSETDAPYVAPFGRRGQRNDPLAVVDVVTKIAEIRGDDPETVRATLFTNAERLFCL